MIDKSIPFGVRRARLLLGLTPMELGELSGVDVGMVYRWELGLACPSPEIWAGLRTATLKACSFLDVDLVRVSPVYKYIVDIDDLTSPIVASKGIIEALKAVGAYEDEDLPGDITELPRKSPHYAITGARALEIIRANPRWHSGEIVYVESHFFAPNMEGGIWMEGMLAPLPERIAALIEFAPSKRGPEDGFWVHPITLEDMPFNRPQ
jgi:hypothetical protein